MEGVRGNGSAFAHAPFLVGVAASAGGLDALRELLHGLERGGNLSVVIAQHLSPSHRSVLAELLAQETALEVRVAEDHQPIEPETVYITPPNRDIEVGDGVLVLREPPDPALPKPCADRLFLSMARRRGETCAAVILSGTGSDGAGGARSIKAAGGAVFVQDPRQAAYDGMPRAALATGCADVVPNPAEIGVRLGWLARGEAEEASEPLPEDALERIIHRVHEARGMDLSAYREGTLLRRLRRRLVATGTDSLEAYEAYLGQHPPEMDRLSRELLISVTGFFRDREAFEALQRGLEQAVAERGYGDDIRIWVPGCATGEEAYSVGIALAEVLGDDRDRYRIQILATDLDEEALKEARQGVYPAGAVDGVPEELQERHFLFEGGQVRAAKSISGMIVFARHDLLNDPPFTRLDLISCRNVLIYFRPETQHRLLELFHYALRGSGLLFLGRAEGIGGREHLYSLFDATHRIYRRRDDVRAVPPRFKGSVAASPSPARPASRPGRQNPAVERMQRAAMAHYVPPSVLVDASLQVLRTSGDTSRLLSLPAGEASLNAQQLIREELRSQLITLVARSHREGEAVTGAPVALRAEDDGETGRIRLRVLPVPGAEPGDEALYLVGFETVEGPPGPPREEPPGDVDEAAQHTIEALRAELASTQEHLNLVTDELERANQELQSTNEELQSSNEELQSSNEELETSNEELQSTNEELTTVNEELNRRTEELSAAYDEITTVMDSLSDALLLLDEGLRVKRFNPAARALFGLDHEAAGRPVSVLMNGPLALPDLSQRAAQVMHTGQVVEQQLSEHGETYLMRIRPYRDRYERICGCVLLLVDQTTVARAERGLRESEQRLQTILQHAPLMAWFCDGEGRYRYANPAFEHFFALEPGQAVGRRPDEVLPGEAARTLHASERTAAETMAPAVVECVLRDDGRERHLWLHHLPIVGSDGALDVVCTLALEVTEWRETTERVRLQAQALNAASDGVLVADALAPDMPTLFVNEAFTRITGYTSDELVGRNCRFLQGPDTEPEAVEAIRQALGRSEPVDVRILNYREDGTPFPNRLRINPVTDAEGRTTHFVGILSDVSREVEHERELMHAWRNAEAASRAKSDFLSAMSHELRTPLNAILGFAQLLRDEDTGLTSASHRKYVHHVLSAGTHLQELVSEILDLAKIESGRLSVSVEPVALDALVEECMALVRGDAVERRITLRETVPAGLQVVADPTRAKQILVNLLSNAVKYNRPEGEVHVRADLQRRRVAIDVSDTGFGVDPERRDRLFQAFDRLGQECGTIEGSGIGLAVSRHLAHLMGGELSLHANEVGKGATFRVTLPRADTEGEEVEHRGWIEGDSGARRPGGPEPRRVLHIEDNEMNRMLVRGLIQRRDELELLEAEDGRSGVERALSEAPDLVLLDLHLPDLSGFEVLEELLRRGFDDRIPVIAVSADAQEEQRERAFRCGFTEYLTKPFQVEDLERLLSRR